MDIQFGTETEIGITRQNLVRVLAALRGFLAQAAGQVVRGDAVRLFLGQIAVVRAHDVNVFQREDVGYHGLHGDIFGMFFLKGPGNGDLGFGGTHRVKRGREQQAAAGSAAAQNAATVHSAEAVELRGRVEALEKQVAQLLQALQHQG